MVLDLTVLTKNRAPAVVDRGADFEYFQAVLAQLLWARGGAGHLTASGAPHPPILGELDVRR